MSKDKALLMVINWLEGGDFVYPTKLLDACKEALEQPTQEPMIIKQDNGMVLKLGYDDLPNGTPFYTHPKEWQGLSDDELEELSSEEELMFWGFARAIEAKLKEKNG